jgi:hypothetical protein
MTMLACAESRLKTSRTRVCDIALLGASLAPRWAILFSHPDDFAQEQMEMDRWITVLAHSFSARGIVPVALARPQSNAEQGWLWRLAALDGDSAAILTLDDPSAALADISGGALCAQIARSGPRFAMILDSSLRCRRTLSYRLPAELPSPLELIGWAVALRKRDRLRESAEAAGQGSTCAALIYSLLWNK